MSKYIVRILKDMFDYTILQAKLGNKKQIVEENNGSQFLITYEYMTPLRYIQACAKMMGVSIERLKESRDDDSLKILKTGNLTPNNCGLIYLDPYHNMQDGLHRAIVLNEKGYNKIKVLVVKKI